MKVLVNLLSAVAGGSLTYLRNVIVPLAHHFEDGRTHRLELLVHRSQVGVLPALANLKLHVIDGDFPRSYRRLLWEKQHIGAYLDGVDEYYVPYQVAPLPTGVRTVLMLQNMEPFWHWRYPYDLKTRLRNEVLKQMTWRDLQRADRVIAVSDFARSFLIEQMHLAPDRSVTVLNGCGITFRGEPGPNDVAVMAGLGVGAPFVFTSGSLLPYRRLEDVLGAFACIAPTHPDLSLVITGGYLNDGYVKKIRNLIASSPVSSSIHMLGSVPADAMAVLYRNCSCFVSASEIEACPYTILEAMASGCATIAPQRPPFTELMGDSGLYVAARDAVGFASAVERVISDAALRSRLKHAARQVSQNYTWERCARETYDALTNW